MKKPRLCNFILLCLLVNAIACDDSGDTTGNGPAIVECVENSDCDPGEQCEGNVCVRSVGGEDLSVEDAVLDDTGDVGEQSDPGTLVDIIHGEIGETSDLTGETSDLYDLHLEEPETGVVEDIIEVTLPRISVEITAPSDRDTFNFGDTITFEGLALDPELPAAELAVVWYSDLDGLLNETAPGGDGEMLFSTDGLTVGTHLITVSVTSADGESAAHAIQIAVCGWGEAEDFNGDLSSSVWQIYGDATRDARGWLELTGNEMGRGGSVYNVAEILTDSDVTIQLRVSMGQCANPGPCSSFTEGADGFSMNIWDASDIDDLEATVEAAVNGEGLGYGVFPEPLGSIEIDAFHVEFDTFYNSSSGGHTVTEPSTINHIGIMLNGDPTEHHLWTEAPELEDNFWHDVVIDIEGTHVNVRMDGEEVINGEIAALAFKGGYIGFSGSTGYYTNYHRIDDLSIAQDCSVE